MLRRSRRSTDSPLKPSVLHINLARGWRGGEQQTWLLVKDLAESGYTQGLCAHPNEPLAKAVSTLNDIAILSPDRCLIRPFGIGRWGVTHAHEARGVYLAWWLKKLRQTPYLITRRMQQAPKSHLLTKAAYAQADALVGISSAACRGIKSFLPGANVLRIPSAHSGQLASLTAAQEIRARFSENSESILIGHAGALVDEDKGQSLLIKAAQALRADGYPVVLILLGEGRDRLIFEEAAQGYSWIHMPGQVSPIQDYLKALDFFVFPSRHEGLGSVLLEAMAVRCPIVASDVGGIPDLIEHNETGLLVPANSPDQLQHTIAYLIEDKARAKALAENGFQKAKTIFSSDNMSRAYMDCYAIIA